MNLVDGYYRTTYPDGTELIQYVKDNKNDVGDSVEKEVIAFGAKFERVYVVSESYIKDVQPPHMIQRDIMRAHNVYKTMGYDETKIATVLASYIEEAFFTNMMNMIKSDSLTQYPEKE